MRHRLPEKLYYSIGEVAESFEVKPSLIRYWEKEFQIISPKKNQSGTRKFSAKDIEKFELIFSLIKERGFTLEGAKKELSREKRKPKRFKETTKNSAGVAAYKSRDLITSSL